MLVLFPMMQISSSRPSASGVYSCIAVNEHGVACTSTRVRVVAPPLRPPESPRVVSQCGPCVRLAWIAPTLDALDAHGAPGAPGSQGAGAAGGFIEENVFYSLEFREAGMAKSAFGFVFIPIARIHSLVFFLSLEKSFVFYRLIEHASRCF